MKKILIAVFFLLSMLLLCAFGKQIELLDDRKLIDLEKAIELAKPGADSADDTEGENSEDSSSENGSQIQDHTENEDIIIEIRIRDGAIAYNGTAYMGDVLENPYEFENMLKCDNKVNVKFKLIDNYAEAHTYKCVLNILKKLHSDIGLEFSEGEEDRA